MVMEMEESDEDGDGWRWRWRMSIRRGMMRYGFEDGRGMMMRTEWRWNIRKRMEI